MHGNGWSWVVGVRKTPTPSHRVGRGGRCAVGARRAGRGRNGRRTGGARSANRADGRENAPSAMFSMNFIYL
jgi:hypothetical protein